MAVVLREPGEVVLDQHIQAFTVPAPVAARITLTVLAIFGLTLWLRYAVIENQVFAAACTTRVTLSTEAVTCGLMNVLILLFNNYFFGILALASSTLSVWRPSVFLIALALISAAAGLVLYNTGLSATAVAISVLAFARPSGAKQ